MEKTEFLLREWVIFLVFLQKIIHYIKSVNINIYLFLNILQVNAYHSRDAGKDSRQAFIVFVQLMNQHGILKTDDLITRFFRMSTQMCVDLCYRALSEPNNSPTLVRAKCFHTLDAYVRLITLLVIFIFKFRQIKAVLIFIILFINFAGQAFWRDSKHSYQSEPSQQSSGHCGRSTTY